LRRHFRAQRKALTAGHRAQLDQRITGHLRDSPHFPATARIGAYWAFDGEPCLHALLAQWQGSGIEIALPVVAQALPGGMCFRRWQPGQPMQANKLGIHEPGEQAGLPLASLDVLLMPLVAWDRHGRRLGMGAGYYDQALGALPAGSGPLRVGIGYALQEAEQLPEDSWDVRLQAMVTEQGWFTCGA
jgi:5-formyltetrahydrofolate cyclo-ligase